MYRKSRTGVGSRLHRCRRGSCGQLRMDIHSPARSPPRGVDRHHAAPPCASSSSPPVERTTVERAQRRARRLASAANCAPGAVCKVYSTAASLLLSHVSTGRIAACLQPAGRANLRAPQKGRRAALRLQYRPVCNRLPLALILLLGTVSRMPRYDTVLSRAALRSAQV